MQRMWRTDQPKAKACPHCGPPVETQLDETIKILHKTTFKEHPQDAAHTQGKLNARDKIIIYSERNDYYNIEIVISLNKSVKTGWIKKESFDTIPDLKPVQIQPPVNLVRRVFC